MSCLKVSTHRCASFRVKARVIDGCQLDQRDWHYVGPDAHVEFLKTLLNDVHPKLREFCYPAPGSPNFRPIEMTTDEENDFSNATVCYLCGKGKQYIGAFSIIFFLTEYGLGRRAVARY